MPDEEFFSSVSPIRDEEQLWGWRDSVAFVMRNSLEVCLRYRDEVLAPDGWIGEETLYHPSHSQVLYLVEIKD